MMTSKERISTAMAFKEPDRVPLDIGGINNTTMHVSTERKLMRYLGIEKETEESEIKSIQQMVVVPDEKLMRYFGCDTRSLYITENLVPWAYDASSDTYTDQWGLVYKKNPAGYYYDFYKHPLAGAEQIKDIDNYQFPDPYCEKALTGLPEKIRTYKDDYCLILEGLRECLFGLPSWLRGNVEFYMDLASDDGLADALLDRVLDYHKKKVGFLLERIGRDIDIVKVADDLGTQETTIISPEMYRRHIKPRQAELFRFIKERCDCKILLHSCGAIRALIPDFIEIGVDAINPVQISAKGMDPAGLKKDFGNKITFWGGGIDTQHILSVATPAEIRLEVKKNIEIFKTHGGYVFAQVHNIMPEVPVENIVAMVEAFKEFAPYQE